MAEKYGQRPSALLSDSLGDLALDAEVWKVAVGVENALARARQDDPKNGEQLVLRKMKADAEAERRYEERKRGKS